MVFIQRAQLTWLIVGILTGCFIMTIYSRYHQRRQSDSNNFDDGDGADGVDKEYADLISVNKSADSRVVADQITLAKKQQQVFDKLLRVLCLCVTTAKFHTERVPFIKQTWGKRCDKLIFVSDLDDATLPAIAFTTESAHTLLWSKVKPAFKWAYEKHRNNFEWFLKADDDTYIVMENLKMVLSKMNPDEPAYIGRRLTISGAHGYHSGGAGYLLSRKALKMFVETGVYNDTSKCHSHTNTAGTSEDWEMGTCMQNAGVPPIDVRDELGRSRFNYFQPEVHLTQGYQKKDFWTWHYDKFGYVEGENCCSDTPISFHYVALGRMLEIEYFLYRVQRPKFP